MAYMVILAVVGMVIGPIVAIKFFATKGGQKYETF